MALAYVNDFAYVSSNNPYIIPINTCAQFFIVMGRKWIAMETNEIIVQAANLLIHNTTAANKHEQILGVETLMCDDKVYQLQVCLVPKHLDTLTEAKPYDGVETSYMLNKAHLVEALNKIRTDKGLGEYTDIKYTVQYLFVQGLKYILELRMTATNPQLIQFEQLN